MNRIDRTIDQVFGMSPIANIEPIDATAMEPVVVDDCTPLSQIRTLGDFRRVTEDMRDDLPLNFSWGLQEYRISEISKNNIRKFLAVELTCVTLEVRR